MSQTAVVHELQQLHGDGAAIAVVATAAAARQSNEPEEEQNTSVLDAPPQLSLLRLGTIAAAITGVLVASSMTTGLITVALPTMAKDLEIPEHLLLWYVFFFFASPIALLTLGLQARFDIRPHQRLLAATSRRDSRLRRQPPRVPDRLPAPLTIDASERAGAEQHATHRLPRFPGRGGVVLPPDGRESHVRVLPRRAAPQRRIRHHGRRAAAWILAGAFLERLLRGLDWVAVFVVSSCGGVDGRVRRRHLGTSTETYRCQVFLARSVPAARCCRGRHCKRLLGHPVVRAGHDFRRPITDQAG